MTLVQRIKMLADERKTNFAEIERAIGLSNGQIRRWDDASPKAENLKKVADHLNVSTDYLLGRSDKNNTITVEEALNSVMSYDGKQLTENDREILKGIIEGYLNSKNQ